MWASTYNIVAYRYFVPVAQSDRALASGADTDLISACPIRTYTCSLASKSSCRVVVGQERTHRKLTIRKKVTPE